MKAFNKVKPPLRYPGSKFRAYKYIEPFIELIEHDEYREPFFGSGAVFFQKETVKFNWINDLDEELVNFYLQIQNEQIAKQMAEETKSIIPTKELFENLKNSKPTTNYYRAFRYFVINRTAYSGIMHLPNWGFHKVKSVQPENWGDRILQASQKLQGINITQKSYEELLFAPKQGNSILFFLDPPYFNADQKRAYEKSFQEQDHYILAENLKKVQDPFILTYDDCEGIRKLYDWAYIYPVEFMYCTANSNKTTRKKGKELIITNKKIGL